MNMVSSKRLQYVFRSAFWLVPALCITAASGLALGLVMVDESMGSSQFTFLFPGPPEGARSLLSSITQAMITFTALVFSITIVVLQLASSQFSPRVLRTFLRDRTIQWTFAVFVSTFVYAIIVDRNVLGTTARTGFVPRLAVTVAVAFVLFSVALFIRYIGQVTNMIRVVSIINAVGDESRELLEERCPMRQPPVVAAALSTSGYAALGSPAPGVLVSVNENSIVRHAAKAGCVVELLVRVGDFLPFGAPLARLHPDGPDRPTVDNVHDWLWKNLALDKERTTEQDLAFAFRQLVDIAQRALSPAVSDPTTACQAIDVLHDLLRRFATRPLPSGRFIDDTGQVRLIIPQYAFTDYLKIVVGEIWPYGSAAAQVPQRLASMLRDLREVALCEYQAAIDHWLGVVGDNISAAAEHPRYRQTP
ncbi:MAG: DUF2254 domain-containing protein [Actinomycetota bacterium]|nr:DUF2254 domain-containing protein [Actinomycetota bacterium]